MVHQSRRARGGLSVDANRLSIVVSKSALNIAIAIISAVAITWVMSNSREDFEVNDLLPLPCATFHILMALAEDYRHGYAIIQDVERRTGGELRLSAGTLYRSIQRMLEQGLVIETRDRPSPELDDERRRYYRITPFGSKVAKAEVTRLAKLLRLARSQGFVPEKA